MSRYLLAVGNVILQYTLGLAHAFLIISACASFPALKLCDYGRVRKVIHRITAPHGFIL
jgi:hypothetical protein